jgi:hypothetical protein
VPCDALPTEGPRADATVGVVDAGTRAHPLPRLELAVRTALAFAVVYQVVQRFTYTGYGMSEYGRSLWYVSYEHGFVRRGLAGEVLRTITGGRPTIATVDLVQNVVAVVTLGAMVVLVVVLARRRTVITYAAAAALVVAPFAFDSVGGQRRPDLLAFLLLAAVGLWAGTRSVVPTRLALVAGALLALCTLASEAAPLIVAPWLVLVVLAATRARAGPRVRVALPSFLCVAPSAVVLLVLAAHGAPGYDQVRALELDAPNIIEGHGSVFEFLGDTFGTSFHRVIERSHPELSIVVGLALVGLLVAVFRNWLPYVGALGRWLLRSRAERVMWIVATSTCTAALFALGFDWLRWITVITFAALLALAGIVVIDGRAPHPSPARDRWHRPMPEQVAVSGRGILAVAVATYLLVLPPLPNFVSDVVVGVRLLLDVPQ